MTAATTMAAQWGSPLLQGIVPPSSAAFLNNGQSSWLRIGAGDMHVSLKGRIESSRQSLLIEWTLPWSNSTISTLLLLFLLPTNPSLYMSIPYFLTNAQKCFIRWTSDKSLNPPRNLNGIILELKKIHLPLIWSTSRIAQEPLSFWASSIS